ASAPAQPAHGSARQQSPRSGRASSSPSGGAAGYAGVVTHRIDARKPPPGIPASIETDPSILSSVLSDAAHVPGGFASGVAFPASLADLAAAVATATRVLPIGAQSSLTGGATPRGEVVISTRSLTSIALLGREHVRVGAGVPLSQLQQQLARD